MKENGEVPFPRNAVSFRNYVNFPYNVSFYWWLFIVIWGSFEVLKVGVKPYYRRLLVYTISCFVLHLAVRIHSYPPLFTLKNEIKLLSILQFYSVWLFLFMQLRMSRSHSRESEGSHKSDATYSHSRSPSNEKGSPKSRDSRSKSRSKSPYRRSSRRYSGSRSRSRSHSRGHKRYLIMLCLTILCLMILLHHIFLIHCDILKNL